MGDVDQEEIDLDDTNSIEDIARFLFLIYLFSLLT